MPIFQIETAEGTFEVDAPDQTTALSALQLSAEKTSTGFATRENREYEPTREERVASYEEMARGHRQRQGYADEHTVTGLRGAARAFPFFDDLVASGKAMRGEAADHQDALDRVRAQNRVDDEDRPITSYGSQIATGLALPAGAAARGATIAQGAARGALTAGGYGAAYGAGAGDGLADRLGKAATGGAIGGVAGGVLGGALQPLVNRAGQAANPMAQSLANAAARAPNEAERAAKGLRLAVPDYLTTDNMLKQRVAAGLRNVPFVGDDIVKANEGTLEGLGAKVAGEASRLGGGTAEGAGENAAQGIVNWMTTKSKDASKKLYDAVDNLIDPAARAPLNRTLDTIADIAAERQAARIPGVSKATALVQEAAKDADGLTYAGVKKLRSHLGELVNTGILPEGMSGAEVKRLYGALSDDYRSVVQVAGGDKATHALNRADQFYKAASSRREALAKIVGVEGDAPAAMVYDRLLKAAGGTSRQDTNLLVRAKKSMEPGQWDEVVSAVVAKMGRDAEGNFTPDRFITDFNKKLSDAGRDVLFRDHRAMLTNLERVEKITSRMKAWNQKFGNPSGTAQNTAIQNLATGAAGAAAALNPLTLIASAATVAGGKALSQILIKPASARAMVAYSQALEQAVTRPARASLVALQKAARQFSERAASEAGVQLDPSKLLGGMRPAFSGAEGQQKEGGSRR
jgi:hypothetical protein